MITAANSAEVLFLDSLKFLIDYIFHFFHNSKMTYQSKLKSLNLSVTPVRLAVLESLDSAPHSEAAHLFSLVVKTIQTASLQAVYNNLNVLVEHGLVREIKPKGMPAIFETRTGDNHHHLVCRSCSIIVDSDCLNSAPCLTATDPHGFQIDEAEIIFWGLCPDCQNA